MPTPIILDCDPGHDDAVAIVLAHANPAIELLAITTVAGNQTLEKCTYNARRVCALAGIDVPIAAGADAPLRRPLHIAQVHGSTGLDGATFPEPTTPIVDEHAVDLMHRLVTTHPTPVTLVPTGPLTNVALLLRRPGVREHVKEIVLMGGSTERGNITPYAEFNIYVDPEAADEVFRSGLQVTMVGLNVTHQALVSKGVRKRLEELDSPLAQAICGLMTFFTDSYKELLGMPAPPLHDPITVAHLIDPTILQTVRAPVAIEVTGEYTAGATVVDLTHSTGQPDNATVAVGIDRDRFFDLVVEAVASCA